MGSSPSRGGCHLPACGTTRRTSRGNTKAVGRFSLGGSDIAGSAAVGIDSAAADADLGDADADRGGFGTVGDYLNSSPAHPTPAAQVSGIKLPPAVVTRFRVVTTSAPLDYPGLSHLLPSLLSYRS